MTGEGVGCPTAAAACTETFMCCQKNSCIGGNVSWIDGMDYRTIVYPGVRGELGNK